MCTCSCRNTLAGTGATEKGRRIKIRSGKEIYLSVYVLPECFTFPQVFFPTFWTRS